MDSVELEQVCSGRYTTLVLIDMHEREFGMIPQCTDREPSHATESVDADTCGHLDSLR
ncbi:unannotated protein [freshwater metagenome]|uniref:Unannotated protein n=1 Tax=freshwater metagenome TaxID=449393 RepID=A0A6J7UM54_9ZZZZ